MNYTAYTDRAERTAWRSAARADARARRRGREQARKLAKAALEALIAASVAFGDDAYWTAYRADISVLIGKIGPITNIGEGD